MPGHFQISSMLFPQGISDGATAFILSKPFESEYPVGQSNRELASQRCQSSSGWLTIRPAQRFQPRSPMRKFFLRRTFIAIP